MKPALEHMPREENESFIVRDFDYNYYPTPWHYHPEYEIVMVTESTGKRFIGDHVCDFEPGNLALIGPNIPHTYYNDEKYYEKNSTLRAKSIVIHFHEHSFGENFLKLPEAHSIKKLLDSSQQGIDITGKTAETISKMLFEIVHLSGLKRWLLLVELLSVMAGSGDLNPVTKWSQTGYNEKESKRLGDVFDWIIGNFQEDVSLAEAAAIAQMNENAFSRFFSNRTRKTFSGFVQELRLQKAARLLIENDELSVTQICYECGYNNICNFNRQFLNYYHISPSKYKKSFETTDSKTIIKPPLQIARDSQIFD
ncbi:MAG TPA: AraC family transcriptional regulator [Niabella sp.]|nr:AraC family transcriptional regulator [Niabella sp.]